MAAYTNKYHLIKPSFDDFGDVTELNSNMDIIDEALAKHDEHTSAKDNPHEVTAAQVGAAVAVSYTATISATWAGTAAPYTQTVTVTGIAPTDKQVHITPVYSTINADAVTQQKAWNLISKGDVTATNTIKFTCFDKKPTVPINVSVEVTR